MAISPEFVSMAAMLLSSATLRVSSKLTAIISPGYGWIMVPGHYLQQAFTLIKLATLLFCYANKPISKNTNNVNKSIDINTP